MKHSRIIVLIIFQFCVVNCHAQLYESYIKSIIRLKEDSKLVAFTLEDSLKCVDIIDSLQPDIRTHLYYFANRDSCALSYIHKYTTYKDSQDILMKTKNLPKNYPVYDSIIANIPDDTCRKFILYFFPIEKNIIIGSLCKYRKNQSLEYGVQTCANAIFEFICIFEMNKIVFYKSIHWCT